MRSGAQTSSAPKRRAAVCWPGCLATQISVALGAASRTAASVSSPIVPAPMIATFSPGWTSAIARGVQRARQRLDQHGVLVAEVVGHGVQLRRRARPGPRSSRRRCRGRSRSAGRRETSPSVVLRHSATRPCAHSGHGGEAAHGAAERGLDDDALAAPRAGADLAHDLVAGDERRAGQRREVQRGLAGEQREVGAADAGQRRADRQPARAGRARRADLLQRQRARAGQARARRRRTSRGVGV